MRRYVGCRDPQQPAAVERDRLPGRAHKIRRRDPRTGFAGAPAEHHPGGRHGTPRGRAHRRGDRCHRLHARPRAAGFAARRGIVRQGALGGARHPDGRGQPPAGAYPLALHRPARPRTAPSRLPVPLPAGQRRAYADRTRGFAARYGDHRHDDRRRRRRSVRQMRRACPTPAAR